MRGRLGLLLASLLIAGCAVRGPVFEHAPHPKEGDVLIYIYRTASGPNRNIARDAYFYINDINVADLSSGGYTWFHLPRKPYLLSQKWPFPVAGTTRLVIDGSNRTHLFYRQLQPAFGLSKVLEPAK